MSDKMRQAVVMRGTPVFKKYNIKKAVLFGSVADGRSRETSDVDILVMPLPNQAYWDFMSDLEQSLECFVDVYTQEDDPEFVEKILARGEVVYEI